MQDETAGAIEINDPEGKYAPSEIIKGKGWAGPWRLRKQEEVSRHKEKDSTTDMQIVHGKLNVAWPVPGGRLGMLEAPPGKSFRVRPMKKAIDLGEESISYFSMMTHEPARVGKHPKHQGIRLTLRSSQDYWGQHLSFGISEKLRPHLNNGMGIWLKSAATLEARQSLLWVGKIMSRKNGDDEVTFRVYGEEDILDYAEPAEWHVVSRGFDMDAKLDLVLLTSNGAAPRIIDELRIGPTWRSVVPIRTIAKN